MENKSPLYDWHVGAGAKLADFGGWDMPIEYPKFEVNGSAGGVIAEHTAVRETVGIFDVSHLGKLEIRGTGAVDFLNTIITNDLSRVGNGSAQYTLLCDENGGVIDDLIVYRKADDNLFLVPNAANCAAVSEAISKAAPAGITVTNRHKHYGVIAVQGPKTVQILESLGISLDLDYMEFTTVTIPGHENLGEIIVCRTGYTGEYGYEIIPTWDKTVEVWELLLVQAKLAGGRVCGLGARDTLRTEMGYPLHGHELSLEITPLEASASWAIVMTKPTFHGKTALERQKSEGLKRRLRGLKALDRGIPRAGMSVLDETGNQVGTVTSGTFSPTLKCGIALALITPSIPVGSKLTIDIRGRKSEVEVVTPPFVPSHVR